MRNLAIICLLFASLFVAPAAFSKEVASANMDGDSAYDKFGSTFGTDINKKGKDDLISVLTKARDSFNTVKTQFLRSGNINQDLTKGGVPVNLRDELLALLSGIRIINVDAPRTTICVKDLKFSFSIVSSNCF